jgi:histidine triad (HIT) family protein
MEECIFCKVISGQIPSNKVFEDDEIIVIKDINPKAPIHLLVIPKKHVKNLSELGEGDKDLIAKLNLTAVKIAKDMGFGDKFKLTTNVGQEAGQVVMHLHYHLLSGWKSKDDVVSELHI